MLEAAISSKDVQLQSDDHSILFPTINRQCFHLVVVLLNRIDTFERKIWLERVK